MTDQKKPLQGGATPAVGNPLPLMAMAALGVVFGDIGTSPLYTLSACLSAMSLPPTATNLQGVLSLIFWTLVLVVSVKYAWVIMRASNQGEGGVMALTALASHATGHSNRLRWREGLKFMPLGFDLAIQANRCKAWLTRPSTGIHSKHR
ncbi:KUP/HAK/KT family potassium transporter [Acidithiobacillus ferrooxidans]|uniref:KUP/HAK/KT family potassium transporter n=1 Tax=Acidithiobacillus ferrooxidans TaxID=920 RepID=UPI001D02A329|nr:KUP/HAK/KT family potassium transporter [Acidithiobacillus ferrooxidans]